MPVAIERALLTISSIGMKYALSVYLRKLIALYINLNYNSNSYNNTNQHIFQKKLWAWYFHHAHSHTKSFD